MPHQKPTNPPQLEKVLAGLWMARDGLIEFLEAHGRECDCWTCADVAGDLHMVRLIVGNLESQMFSLQPHLRKVEQEGFPSADDLACMIHHWRRREREDEADYQREVEESWDAEDERRRREAGGDAEPV